MNAKRDWGHAKDYVEAMWLMLQQHKPLDLVISTGEQHSVREFAELAAKEIGIDISWEGSGLNEVGIDSNGNKIIAIDKRYFRPSEVNTLLGDASKAKQLLGWSPKISFKELVSQMINSDFDLEKNNK